MKAQKIIQQQNLQHVKTYKQYETLGYLDQLLDDYNESYYIAESECIMAFLPCQKFYFMEEIVQDRLDIIKQSIQKVFTTITNEQMHKMLQKCYTIKFIKGQKVYKEGDVKPDLAYITLQGEFNQTKSHNQIDSTFDENDPTQVKLKNKIVHNFQDYEIKKLSIGEMFGEIELLKKLPRFYTVQCNSVHGELLVLKRDIFEEQVVVKRKMRKDLRERVKSKLDSQENLEQEFKNNIDLCKQYLQENRKEMKSLNYSKNYLEVNKKPKIYKEYEKVVSNDEKFLKIKKQQICSNKFKVGYNKNPQEYFQVQNKQYNQNFKTFNQFNTNMDNYDQRQSYLNLGDQSNKNSQNQQKQMYQSLEQNKNINKEIQVNNQQNNSKYNQYILNTTTGESTEINNNSYYQNFNQNNQNNNSSSNNNNTTFLSTTARRSSNNKVNTLLSCSKTNLSEPHSDQFAFKNYDLQNNTSRGINKRKANQISKDIQLNTYQVSKQLNSPYKRQSQNYSTNTTLNNTKQKQINKNQYKYGSFQVLTEASTEENQNIYNLKNKNNNNKSYNNLPQINSISSQTFDQNITFDHNQNEYLLKHPQINNNNNNQQFQNSNTNQTLEAFSTPQITRIKTEASPNNKSFTNDINQNQIQNYKLDLNKLNQNEKNSQKLPTTLRDIQKKPLTTKRKENVIRVLNNETQLINQLVTSHKEGSYKNALKLIKKEDPLSNKKKLGPQQPEFQMTREGMKKFSEKLIQFYKKRETNRKEVQKHQFQQAKKANNIEKMEKNNELIKNLEKQNQNEEQDTNRSSKNNLNKSNKKNKKKQNKNPNQYLPQIGGFNLEKQAAQQFLKSAQQEDISQDIENK